MTAWMLSSFIISSMSKHCLTLQEDFLINIINTIWPGTWGGRWVRPEFSLAPACINKGKGAPGSRATTAWKHQARGNRPPVVTDWESAVMLEFSQSLCLAGVSSSAPVRNTLLQEANRVFSVDISKLNTGNFLQSRYQVSDSPISALTPEKTSKQ